LASAIDASFMDRIILESLRAMRDDKGFSR
jgi:hypothetical protein